MKIFKKIKNIFNNIFNVREDQLTASEIFKEKHKQRNKVVCKNCPLISLGCDINIMEEIYNKSIENGKCFFEDELKNFDRDKDSFFIIDDNEGMVSFLEDDLYFLEESGVLNLKDINVISLSGNYSGFTFEVLQEKEKGLNIKWAIIDITLGGSIMTSKGNLKYTGIDVLEMILKYNPDVNYIFYTGNNLNPYIKRTRNMMDKFKKITNDDIENHVLFKTSLDMDDRRRYLAKKFFNKEI